MHGIFPILNTTFHDDGSLDLESQARLVDYLLEAGAHGLGLFGNASEGYALGDSERQALLALIAAQVKGRVPLVVSTGATGTDLAVRGEPTGPGFRRRRPDGAAAVFLEARRRRADVLL